MAEEETDGESQAIHPKVNKKTESSQESFSGSRREILVKYFPKEISQIIIKYLKYTPKFSNKPPMMPELLITEKLIGTVKTQILKLADFSIEDVKKIWRDPKSQQHMLIKFKETPNPIYFLQRLDWGNKSQMLNYYGLNSYSVQDDIRRIHNFFVIVCGMMSIGSILHMYGDDRELEMDKKAGVCKGNFVKLYYSLNKEDREVMVQWANAQC